MQVLSGRNGAHLAPSSMEWQERVSRASMLSLSTRSPHHSMDLYWAMEGVYLPMIFRNTSLEQVPLGRVPLQTILTVSGTWNQSSPVA